MARKPKVQLTKLESEVMRAVWAGEPDSVRVRDVVDTLNRGRSRKLAYNTVQTMLTILMEKGIVERVDGPGRGHHYVALISRSEASRHMVGDLVNRLFDGRVQPLLQQLIDESHLDPSDLRKLRRWVNARLRDVENSS